MNRAATELDQVVALVEEVVGVQGLTADSNLFDVGGDSLTAAHLSLLFEERFGTPMDVFTIYASENLAEIHQGLLVNAGSPA
ncbi:acyl carrier protein [Spongiactinospora sp. 9N601]|uniref:acyl carrier protein n=1 Tax=Spongiactinospora sp. 9N601 TaxID=3375149 RepID=UPI0037AEBAE7